MFIIDLFPEAFFFFPDDDGDECANEKLMMNLLIVKYEDPGSA